MLGTQSLSKDIERPTAPWGISIAFQIHYYALTSSPSVVVELLERSCGFGVDMIGEAPRREPIDAKDLTLLQQQGQARFQNYITIYTEHPTSFKK